MDYSSNFGNRPQPADQGYVSISAGGGPVIVLNDRYSASNLMTSLPQPATSGRLEKSFKAGFDCDLHGISCFNTMAHSQVLIAYYVSRKTQKLNP